MCADIYEAYKCTKISDEELKEWALKRRREQTGFEDEEEFQPEQDEQEDADENHDDEDWHD